MSKFSSLNLWAKPTLANKLDIDSLDAKVSIKVVDDQNVVQDIPIEFENKLTLKSASGDILDLAQALNNNCALIVAGASSASTASALDQTNLDSAVVSLTSQIGTVASDLSVFQGVSTAQQTADATARGVITADLASEITRATTAETTLQSNIDAEQTDRTTAIASEVTRATTAETTLQSNIDVEKARIDAILQNSTIDLDTLKEIVDQFQADDTGILATLTSLQATVATLQSDFTSLVSSLN